MSKNEIERQIARIAHKYPWDDSKELFISELTHLVELAEQRGREKMKEVTSCNHDWKKVDSTRCTSYDMLLEWRRSWTEALLVCNKCSDTKTVKYAETSSDY